MEEREAGETGKVDKQASEMINSANESGRISLKVMGTNYR